MFPLFSLDFINVLWIFHLEIWCLLGQAYPCCADFEANINEIVFLIPFYIMYLFESLFIFIYLKGNEMVIFHSVFQMVTWTTLSHAEARSLVFHPRLPHGCQVPRS